MRVAITMPRRYLMGRESARSIAPSKKRKKKKREEERKKNRKKIKEEGVRGGGENNEKREKNEMERTEESVKRAALSQTSPKARFIGVL